MNATSPEDQQSSNRGDFTAQDLTDVVNALGVEVYRSYTQQSATVPERMSGILRFDENHHVTEIEHPEADGEPYSPDSWLQQTLNDLTSSLSRAPRNLHMAAVEYSISGGRLNTRIHYRQDADSSPAEQQPTAAPQPGYSAPTADSGYPAAASGPSSEAGAEPHYQTEPGYGTPLGYEAAPAAAEQPGYSSPAAPADYGYGAPETTGPVEPISAESPTPAATGPVDPGLSPDPGYAAVAPRLYNDGYGHNTAGTAAPEAPEHSGQAEQPRQQHRQRPGIMIDQVDVGPAELTRQLPAYGELIAVKAGPDRPDYCVVEMNPPLQLTVTPDLDPSRFDQQFLQRSEDGVLTASVSLIVIASRFEGTQVAPDMRDLWVNLAYVVDNSLLSDEHLDFAKVHYAAVARINLTQ